MYLTGVNLGGFLSQAKLTKNHLKTFITDKDIKCIKSWGFNVIRLPVDYILFEDDKRPFIYDEEKIKYIDNVINTCIKNDITLILDLHKAPGHSFSYKERDKNNIWDKKSKSRKRFLKIWEFFSQRYKNYSSKLIFEILNEPVADNDDDWNKLAEETIKIIRKTDTEKFIIIESNKWGHCDKFKKLKKFDDDKIIYSFHFYDPIIVTHQLAEWTSFYIHNIYRQKVKYPGKPEGIKEAKKRLEKKDKKFLIFFKNQDKNWNKKELEKILIPVLKFRDKNKVNILCGEFGTNVKADPETRINWTRDIIELFKKNEISYTYWNYKNMDFGLWDFTEKYKENPNYNKKRLDENILKVLQSGIKK